MEVGVKNGVGTTRKVEQTLKTCKFFYLYDTIRIYNTRITCSTPYTDRLLCTAVQLYSCIRFSIAFHHTSQSIEHNKQLNNNLFLYCVGHTPID